MERRIIPEFKVHAKTPNPKLYAARPTKRLTAGLVAFTIRFGRARAAPQLNSMLCMRSLSFISFGLILAAAASAAAAAEPYFQGMRPNYQGQPPSQASAPPPGAERPLPQRDLRLGGDAGRARMTVDERRQLRRDVQDAGRDIYRPARPGPGGRGRR